MRRSSVLACLLSLALGSGAFAGDTFDWTFTANGGTIADNDISLFPILLDDPGAPGKSVPNIATMELVLTDLRHSFPADLDIYLIDPMLQSIKIMTDRGAGLDIGPPGAIVNLTFEDDAAGPLPSAAQIVSGSYRPDGLVTAQDGGFAEFTGQSGGTANWLLLIIDDAEGDAGSLGSFTLRGTVPEPATLSLLAIGALAALRRKVR